MIIISCVYCCYSVIDFISNICISNANLLGKFQLWRLSLHNLVTLEQLLHLRGINISLSINRLAHAYYALKTLKRLKRMLLLFVAHKCTNISVGHLNSDIICFDFLLPFLLLNIALQLSCLLKFD